MIHFLSNAGTTAFVGALVILYPNWVTAGCFLVCLLVDAQALWMRRRDVWEWIGAESTSASHQIRMLKLQYDAELEAQRFDRPFCRVSPELMEKM